MSFEVEVHEDVTKPRVGESLANLLVELKQSGKKHSDGVGHEEKYLIQELAKFIIPISEANSDKLSEVIKNLVTFFEKNKDIADGFDGVVEFENFLNEIQATSSERMALHPNDPARDALKKTLNQQRPLLQTAIKRFNSTFQNYLEKEEDSRFRTKLLQRAEKLLLGGDAEINDKEVQRFLRSVGALILGASLVRISADAQNLSLRNLGEEQLENPHLQGVLALSAQISKDTVGAFLAGAKQGTEKQKIESASLVVPNLVLPDPTVPISIPVQAKYLVEIIKEHPEGKSRAELNANITAVQPYLVQNHLGLIYTAFNLNGIAKKVRFHHLCQLIHHPKCPPIEYFEKANEAPVKAQQVQRELKIKKPKTTRVPTAKDPTRRVYAPRAVEQSNLTSDAIVQALVAALEHRTDITVPKRMEAIFKKGGRIPPMDLALVIQQLGLTPFVSSLVQGIIQTNNVSVTYETIRKAQTKASISRGGPRSQTNIKIASIFASDIEAPIDLSQIIDVKKIPTSIQLPDTPLLRDLIKVLGKQNNADDTFVYSVTGLRKLLNTHATPLKNRLLGICTLLNIFEIQESQHSNILQQIFRGEHAPTIVWTAQIARDTRPDIPFPTHVSFSPKFEKIVNLIKAEQFPATIEELIPLFGTSEGYLRKNLFFMCKEFGNEYLPKYARYAALVDALRNHNITISYDKTNSERARLSNARNLPASKRVHISIEDLEIPKTITLPSTPVLASIISSLQQVPLPYQLVSELADDIGCNSTYVSMNLRHIYEACKIQTLPAAERFPTLLAIFRSDKKPTFIWEEKISTRSSKAAKTTPAVHMPEKVIFSEKYRPIITAIQSEANPKDLEALGLCLDLSARHMKNRMHGIYKEFGIQYLSTNRRFAIFASAVRAPEIEISFKEKEAREKKVLQKPTPQSKSTPKVISLDSLQTPTRISLPPYKNVRRVVEALEVHGSEITKVAQLNTILGIHNTQTCSALKIIYLACKFDDVPKYSRFALLTALLASDKKPQISWLSTERQSIAKSAVKTKIKTTPAIKVEAPQIFPSEVEFSMRFKPIVEILQATPAPQDAEALARRLDKSLGYTNMLLSALYQEYGDYYLRTKKKFIDLSAGLRRPNVQITYTQNPAPRIPAVSTYVRRKATAIDLSFSFDIEAHPLPESIRLNDTPSNRRIFKALSETPETCDSIINLAATASVTTQQARASVKKMRTLFRLEELPFRHQFYVIKGLFQAKRVQTVEWASAVLKGNKANTESFLKRSEVIFNKRLHKIPTTITVAAPLQELIEQIRMHSNPITSIDYARKVFMIEDSESIVNLTECFRALRINDLPSSCRIRILQKLLQQETPLNIEYGDSLTESERKKYLIHLARTKGEHSWSSAAGNTYTGKSFGRLILRNTTASGAGVVTIGGFQYTLSMKANECDSVRRIDYLARILSGYGYRPLARDQATKEHYQNWVEKTSLDVLRSSKTDPQLKDDLRKALIDQAVWIASATKKITTVVNPGTIDDFLPGVVLMLEQVIEKFDPSFDTQLMTFYIMKIENYLRETERNNSAFARSDIEQLNIIEGLLVESGRSLSIDEIIQETGWHIKRVRQLLDLRSKGIILDYDGMISGDENETVPFIDLIRDDKSLSGLDETLDDEMGRYMRTGLARLRSRAPREFEVLSLYYNERLTFKQIGAALNVSESRVYQLHTQAVRRMKVYIETMVSGELLDEIDEIEVSEEEQTDPVLTVGLDETHVDFHVSEVPIVNPLQDVELI